MFKNKNKGFTIIELIVVIAITTILAAVVSVNVIEYLAKARDSKRKEDVRNIVVALETYYIQNGSYPYGEFVSTCGTKLTGTDPFSLAFKDNNIMSIIPTVPSNSGGNCGDSYYAGSWPELPSPQGAGVFVSLEKDDPNCKTPMDWEKSGSYCTQENYKNIYLQIVGE